MKTALAPEFRATARYPQLLLLGLGLDAVSGVRTYLDEFFESTLSPPDLLRRFESDSC